MVKPVVVDTTSRSSGDVWYFAYGSNLHPQRRATRAGLSPVDSAPGTLCGWRLVFDMPGVPPAEPAMASIRRDATGEVHGLLLRLRAQEFAALVGSEGGDRFYVREQVEVIAYDGRGVIAEVFVAAPGRRLQREGTPSRRYLELIREGARLSALCPEYCAWLEALPHAEASPTARWASDLFLEVFMRASRGPLRGLAQGWLDALQRTEELGPLPRRVAQGVLLAPVLGVGVGLRALERKP
ncbi:Gamma-glutamyl cyclotransferase, AIG2-like [Nannocystis exedens]|uniref:Gamma-glutamyl cyclotransferase, AIG2-like n=1 Tax=Nannocystis exedens TaxID=54 RepID=A0A1I2EMJ1_9BACT|nr:gamma-glutamylcyclotransferase family protein [Nannocystis exedens]PCC73948.1 AIG2 family protein [Nannocystis exedens]SFE93827.1 Gamma-glutamyl cyclotransferase, AIG2-like [Nannocystis exedens]